MLGPPIVIMPTNRQHWCLVQPEKQAMSLTAGARTILSEFQNPSKRGVRLPTYPDLQKTSIYSQVENGVYGVNTADAAISVIRDATFPLWAVVGTTGNSGATGAGFQQLSYEAAGPLGTDENSRTVPLDGVWTIESSNFQVSSITGGVTTATEQRMGVAGVSNMYCGTPVIAVMPNIDEREWLYCPNGWAMGFGLSLGFAPDTLGAAQVIVRCTVEVRAGPEIEYADIQMTGISAASMTGAATNTAGWAKVAEFNESGRYGYYIRLKNVELKTVSGTAVYNNFKPAVSLWTFGVTAVTFTASANAKMPIVVGAGTVAAGFQPLVNMAINRSTSTSASALVAAANKVVSTALTLANATKVMNQEGTFNCLRYYENGVHGLTRPPKNFNGFNPEDRAFVRMAAGLRVAVRPSHEMEFFEDTRVTYGAGPIGVDPVYWPALRLWKHQHVNLIRCEDPDTATVSQINYTLKQNLEFINNDVLLRPTYSEFEIEDLHKAVKAFCKAPIWISGDVAHYNLVDRTVQGTPASGAPRRQPRAMTSKKAKPKPPALQRKRAPKPAAQGKGGKKPLSPPRKQR